MRKNRVDDLRLAFNEYNLNDDDDLPEKILRYVYDRIETNRVEIEKIASIYEIKIIVDEILNIINNEIKNKPEQIGKTIINKNGFMFAQALMPVGIVVVKAYDSIEIIKYWIKAIKSRNAIAISSETYNKYSIEALVLVILKEALVKYNLNENLISYIPHEECKYQDFDRAIYTYDNDGKILDTANVEDLFKLRPNADKKYVYIESEELRKEAEENTDVEFIEGSIDEAVSKVKNANAAVIYTTNSQKAYEFINLACCDNVFINTSLENIFHTIKSNDQLYIYRNIILPVPKELISKKKDNEKEDNTFNITNNNNKNYSERLEKNNMMVEYKESLWNKLKKRFKNLFKM